MPVPSVQGEFGGLIVWEKLNALLTEDHREFAILEGSLRRITDFPTDLRFETFGDETRRSDHSFVQVNACDVDA